MSGETELPIQQSLQWRDRARAVRTLIRDRFRVAVDRRRHQLRFRPVQRWADRIRSLCNYQKNDLESSSYSSSASFRFYRKKVSKDLDSIDDSILLRFAQSLAIPLIGTACHVFMHGLNLVQVYGAEKLHKAVLERPEGKPLITVSNHVAAIDDPFIIASLLPPSIMRNPNNLRWTLCASDRCFKNRAMSAFFKSVKVLPVSRGEGIYQKGMDMALSKLNKGGWVHIFPEGSRSRDGGKTVRPTKRGVGRLVMDADNIPLVIPFVHSGMQNIMPLGSKFPKIGKRVIVVIGDPISFDDLLIDKSESLNNLARGNLYDEISSRIGLKLQELKILVDKLALEQELQIQTNNLQNQNLNSHDIFQHVDWEAFGIDNLVTYSTNDNNTSQINSKKEDLKDSTQLREKEKDVVSSNSSKKWEFYGRIRGYMNPNELMGFAARGLFVNGRFLEDGCEKRRHVWKEFFEGNLVPRWNCYV
ncbi:hypothetical protein LUZ60_003577 [Juncus effusus]|nr:hypothetical protein LUZ60_003577 [Juncus effusus]